MAKHLPALARSLHVSHAKRCLTGMLLEPLSACGTLLTFLAPEGLPGSQVEADGARYVLF